MADTLEKIYCTDGRDNDLAAILAATKNNDPATMMAAMGCGMNNWMNNPFVYLVWMMFANRMWGGEQVSRIVILLFRLRLILFAIRWQIIRTVTCLWTQFMVIQQLPLSLLVT